MAEAEEKKHEYYIRLLSFISGPATETLQLYFEIKVLNSLNLFLFLENNKHVLYHELYPTVRCCECSIPSLSTAQQKGRLSFHQFDLLFETDEGQVVKDHRLAQGQQIKQLCLCSVSAKRTTTVDMMDITLLYAVAKICCKPWSVSGNPNWIKEIKTTRNFIAHCPRNEITKSEFERRFSVTEQSVLNLASVVGPVFLKMVKGQISIYKNSELMTIKDIIKNGNDSIHQILEIFVQDQRDSIKMLAHQTGSLAEKTESMKTEVCNQLQENKEIYVDIRNLVFEVKTAFQTEQPKTKDSIDKTVLNDENVCNVEWRVATPGNWNIDEIKEKLEDLSKLMGKWFRIRFVYKGSLVIQTTAPIRLMKNDKDFQLAIKSFLKDFVEICDLDTETKTSIKVELVVSNAPLGSQYFGKEEIKTLKILCDPCSSKNVSSDSILYCYECRQYFCQQCIKRHNLDEPFLHHNLTDIGSLLFITNCSKHNDSAIDFYCVEHDCLCCSFCISDEHFCCETLLPLEDAAKGVKQSVEFDRVAYALSNIKTKLNEVIITQHENCKSLDDDEHKILKQVASCKDSIIKRLDELEDNIRQDGHSLKKIQKSKSESSYSSLSQIEKPIQQISDQMHQISMYGSQTQMFVLINKCKSEILLYESILQKILPTLLKRTLTFQPPDNIQKHGGSLGSIRLNLTQHNVDYKPKDNQAQIAICVPDTTLKFTLVREIKIIHSGNVWISNMGITDDNRLLLCNHYGTCILVYSDCGEYVQDCTLADNPWDIAVMPGEDKAVVTLPLQKSIQFIDIRTLKAKSKHSLPGPCYGVTTVNDKICVGGAGKYLYILDKKGEHINTVKVPVTYSIDYLHAGPYDSVYYTDFTYNAVSCVTLDGKQRFRYTSNYLDQPRGVIADGKGNLYVSCQGSHNIQRLTPHGEFIDVILDKGSTSSTYDLFGYELLGMVFSNDYRQLFVSSHIKDKQYVLVFSCP